MASWGSFQLLILAAHVCLSSGFLAPPPPSCPSVARSSAGTRTPALRLLARANVAKASDEDVVRPLFEANKRWIKSKKEKDPEYFEK
eukprot:745730-Hanusia_phi.AAC.1